MPKKRAAVKKTAAQESSLIKSYYYTQPLILHASATLEIAIIYAASRM